MILRMLALVTLFGCIYSANGACFVSSTLPNFDGGENFCEYEGYKFRNGSSFQTPHCYDCQCEGVTLYCCGFGAAMTSVHGIPPWCEWKIDGCDATPVMKADPTMHCAPIGPPAPMAEEHP